LASTIDVLQEIQRVDLEISKVEKEGNKYRENIAKVSAEVESLEGDLEGISLESEEMESLLKEINEEIRINNDKVEKDEVKLNDVTSDKALKALSKEIATAKRVVKAAKERLDKISPQCEEKRSVVEEKRAVIDTRLAEIESMKEEMEARGGEWQKTLAARNSERESVIKDLNPSVLKRYETIKSRRGGQGLAKVFNETCQGCFIHIPPQVYNILIKGTEELIACPNCHRILYFLSEEASTDTA
jgi:hypothetical protein